MLPFWSMIAEAWCFDVVAFRSTLPSEAGKSPTPSTPTTRSLRQMGNNTPIMFCFATIPWNKGVSDMPRLARISGHASARMAGGAVPRLADKLSMSPGSGAVRGIDVLIICRPSGAKRTKFSSDPDRCRTRATARAWMAARSSDPCGEVRAASSSGDVASVSSCIAVTRSSLSTVCWMAWPVEISACSSPVRRCAAVQMVSPIASRVRGRAIAKVRRKI